MRSRLKSGRAGVADVHWPEARPSGVRSARPLPFETSLKRSCRESAAAHQGSRRRQRGATLRRPRSAHYSERLIHSRKVGSESLDRLVGQSPHLQRRAQPACWNPIASRNAPRRSRSAPRQLAFSDRPKWSTCSSVNVSIHVRSALNAPAIERICPDHGLLQYPFSGPSRRTDLARSMEAQQFDPRVEGRPEVA